MVNKVKHPFENATHLKKNTQKKNDCKHDLQMVKKIISLVDLPFIASLGCHKQEMKDFIESSDMHQFGCQ